MIRVFVVYDASVETEGIGCVFGFADTARAREEFIAFCVARLVEEGRSQEEAERSVQWQESYLWNDLSVGP